MRPYWRMSASRVILSCTNLSFEAGTAVALTLGSSFHELSSLQQFHAPGQAAGSAVLPGSWTNAQQRAPSSICLLMHQRAFPEWKRYRGATARATQHGLLLWVICIGS